MIAMTASMHTCMILHLKAIIKDNKELHPLVKYKTCYATLDDVDGCKYLSNADKRELTETVSFNRNNSGKSYHR